MNLELLGPSSCLAIERVQYTIREWRTTDAMKPATRDRLLALNRQFYADVAEPFHSTRRSWPQGNVRLLDSVPPAASERPVRVLDAGCGNGRFAAVLNSLGTRVRYTGVDANARLLELATDSTAGLAHVEADFVRADLTDPGWTRQLGDTPCYDMVVCLSTLQHMPGSELRVCVLQSVAKLLAPGGRLAVSAWQFLTSPRLAARQIEWTAVGVDGQDMEAGDALLPWKQDVYAVRYVHQIDLPEMETLAAAAGLLIDQSYYADGKTGDLNLYAIMRTHESALRGA